MATLKFINAAINQETGRRVRPGDIVELGEMEAGRHLAEGNAVPATDIHVERAVTGPQEVRRKIRRVR